jgi:hypothetical protein
VAALPLWKLCSRAPKLSEMAFEMEVEAAMSTAPTSYMPTESAPQGHCHVCHLCFLEGLPEPHLGPLEAPWLGWLRSAALEREE